MAFLAVIILFTTFSEQPKKETINRTTHKNIKKNSTQYTNKYNLYVKYTYLENMRTKLLNKSADFEGALVVRIREVAIFVAPTWKTSGMG